MSRITTVAKPKPKPSKKDSLFHLPFGYKTYIRPKPWHPAGSSAQAPMSCSSGTGSFFSPATSLSSSIPYTYFYILQIRGPACMGIDLNLGIIVTFFRTIADLFYLGQMVPKFRTPSSRVFGRGELVKNPHQIAVRYLRSDFVIDLIAMLPIPQGFTEVSLLVTAISLLPRTYWQPVPTLIKMLVCDNYNKYDRMNHTLFSNKQSLQYHDAHNLIQKLVFLGVHLKFS